MPLSDNIRRINQMLMQELLRRRQHKDSMKYLQESMEGYRESDRMRSEQYRETLREQQAMGREADWEQGYIKALNEPSLLQEIHFESARAENSGDKERASKLRAQHDDYAQVMGQILEKAAQVGPEGLSAPEISTMIAFFKGDKSLAMKFIEDAGARARRAISEREVTAREGELGLGMMKYLSEKSGGPPIGVKEETSRQIGMIDDLINRVKTVGITKTSEWGVTTEAEISPELRDQMIGELVGYRGQLSRGTPLTPEQEADLDVLSRPTQVNEKFERYLERMKIKKGGTRGAHFRDVFPRKGKRVEATGVGPAPEPPVEPTRVLPGRGEFGDETENLIRTLAQKAVEEWNRLHPEAPKTLEEAIEDAREAIRNQQRGTGR